MALKKQIAPLQCAPDPERRAAIVKAAQTEGVSVSRFLTEAAWERVQRVAVGAMLSSEVQK